MIIDAHIHCTGNEKVDDILTTLDAAGVDKAILLAPFLTGDYSLQKADSLGAANQYLANLIADHTDRLIGFAVINPALPKASEDLYYAHALGLPGLKMGFPPGGIPTMIAHTECMKSPRF